MTQIDDGGPVYPSGEYFGGHHENGSEVYLAMHEGMSLRDWFAGQALAGHPDNLPMPQTLASAAEILGISEKEYSGDNWEQNFATLVARYSYIMADAMLAARKRGEE